MLSHGGRDHVITIEDLLRIEQAADGSVRADLDNVEYALTAAVKKLAGGARTPRVALWTPPGSGSQRFELLRRYLEGESATPRRPAELSGRPARRTACGPCACPPSSRR